MKRELWITCFVVLVCLPALAIALLAAVIDQFAGAGKRGSGVDHHGDVYEI